MKKLLMIFLAFICSIAVGYYFPKVFEAGSYNKVNIKENSLIKQEMYEMVDEPIEITKVYYKENLIGVITNNDLMDEIKEEAYKTLYEAEFPNVEIRFDDNIYVVPEYSYYHYENVDEQIKQYFFDNDLFLVNAYKITISNEKEDKIIYVRNVADFKNALKRYLLNFIDEDTYNLLNEGKTISSITEYGTKNIDIKISEKITSELVSISASSIKLTEDDIFDYLCYSDNTKLKYYTVLPYDTVEGIAELYKLSIDQLLAINDNLENAEQVLSAGEQINVTYFNSPLTVTVSAQRLAPEPIYRDATHYIQDTSKPGNYYEVEVEGVDGNRDTLYTDIYVNGQLVSYKQESSVITREPVAEVVRVGTSYKKIKSEFDWCLPCDNPYIICNVGCYEGHYGVDFKNRYVTFCDVFSVESGVVFEAGWSDNNGYYLIMQIGDYFVIYGHLNKPVTFEVGDYIERHQYVGQMGRTGIARSVHVHIGITYQGFEDENRIHPCSLLPCEIIGK